MNIEVGKTYQTRGGKQAIVESVYDDEPIYQLSGNVFDENGNVVRLAHWMRDGRYSADHQTDFDLVEITELREENEHDTN